MAERHRFPALYDPGEAYGPPAAWWQLRWNDELVSFTAQLVAEQAQDGDLVDVGPMGWVLSRLRQTNAPDELIGEIQNAVDARNWLAHQFFWDHAVDFNTETGCQRMLAELEAMRIQFEECTVNIDKVVYRWLATHGMGPEDVKTIAAKLLQDVDREDSLPR